MLLSDPHPYSTLILGVFPLHQIAHVGVSPRISLKLFGHEIIVEEFEPIWSRYLNVTDGQTDGQTDRQLYCDIAALCVASRGKNPEGQKGIHRTTTGNHQK